MVTSRLLLLSNGPASSDVLASFVAQISEVLWTKCYTRAMGQSVNNEGHPQATALISEFRSGRAEAIAEELAGSSALAEQAGAPGLKVLFFESASEKVTSAEVLGRGDADTQPETGVMIVQNHVLPGQMNTFLDFHGTRHLRDVLHAVGFRHGQVFRALDPRPRGCWWPAAMHDAGTLWSLSDVGGAMKGLVALMSDPKAMPHNPGSDRARTRFGYYSLAG